METVVMLSESEVTLNAAGIADAFRCSQLSDEDGDSRLTAQLQRHDGWVGIMRAVALSAEAMEEFRTKQSRTSQWGLDLPSIYLAWEAVGRALWESDEPSLARNTATSALEDLYEMYEAWCEEICDR